MPARVPPALRREVRERAKGCCEYCLLPEERAFFPHEPDHIIATKHGGQSTADNLALACFDCNRFKGSDLSSMDPVSGELTALFNPRTQNWNEHFEWDFEKIVGKTSCGRATVLALKLNNEIILPVRKKWILAGWFPPTD